MNHIQLITHYGYFILLPLVAIEGPMAMFLAGFLVSLDYLDPLPAFIVSVGGTVLGDVLHYLLGYWGGSRLAARWGKWVGLSPKRLASLEAQFATRGPRLLLISKIAFGISSLILVAAGTIRYSLLRFTFWNTVGALPKALVFMILGYNFGTAYHGFSRAIRDSALLISLVIIMLLLVYGLGRRYRNSLVTPEE